MPSLICTSGVHCANCQCKPEMMAALKIAKCDRALPVPGGASSRAPVFRLPLAPFTRLHHLLSRLGFAPRRCGCAARATRLDAALNRLLTRLQRRF